MHSSPKLLALALAGLASAQRACYSTATYKVIAGDQLGHIAQAHSVSLPQVLFVNPQITNPDVISIGQKIGIPNTDCTPTSKKIPVSCVGLSKYTVEQGNTLDEIRGPMGLSLDQMLAANPLITDPNVIQAGQVIAIPPKTCVAPVVTGRSVASPRALAGSAKSCVGVSNYTVISGDTLSNIAKNNSVSLTQLLAANKDITNPDLIQIGQTIAIPSSDCVIPDATCKPVPAGTYTVIAGDTLYKIAQTHNTTLASIEAVNSQIPDFDKIEIGDVVNLPSCSLPPVAPTPEVATSTCTSGAANYTVVSGDTFTSIAAGKNITLASLKAANSQLTDFDFIVAGQVIHIPICTGTCVTNGSPTYTVVSGDALGQIASHFNLTLAALAAANPQITNVDLIHPGQIIRVPACGAAPPPPPQDCVPLGTGVESKYTVRKDDTLGGVAATFHVTVAAFATANPWIADVNHIEVGWVLNVPLCGVKYVAAKECLNARMVGVPFKA